MAFAFGEQRDENVGAAYFFLAGRLHVNNRALQNALKAGGGFGIRLFGFELRQFFVEIAGQFETQAINLHAAGAQNREGFGVVGQRQKKMFQRRIFVATLVRERQGFVETFFEVTRKHRNLPCRREI